MKRAKYILVPLLGIALLYLPFYFYVEEQGNFHTVTAGMVYRSGQLDEDEWIRYIKKYRIRTILNLRGKHDSTAWYRKETEIARKFGVVHLDYGISATKEISVSSIDEIISLMRKSAKPILVHCQAGADRSGLISAAWKLAVENVPPDKAYEQLSVLYGHFPYLRWGKTKAMDRSYWKYAEYVGNRRLNAKEEGT